MSLEKDLKEVDKLVQKGTSCIKEGHPDAAVSVFLKALGKAELINNRHSVRVCSCNLGGLYLLLGDTQNALQYLEKSLPQNGVSYDSEAFYLNGDVYYNFGLAYLMIKQYEKAISNLKFAIENFDKVASKRASSAESHTLLAQAYTSLLNYKQGASEYKKNADICNELHDYYKAVKALINQANCLYHSCNPESCLSVIRKCPEICRQLEQDTKTGKLYHDLGILFGRTSVASDAIDCFKTALELLPTTPSITTNVVHDQQKLLRYRASCLQHIGELLNVEQHYHESLQYHKKTLRLLGLLSSHKSMGRCFASMAFSYSQLHDYLKAEKAYHNALQKMEEIGDLNGQCLVYESLADVNYEEQDIERAIVHYKLSSSIAQHINLAPSVCRRILSKLANVLECQVSGAVRATLNGQRRPISLSRDKFQGQSIISTPIHGMFTHNKVVPQNLDRLSHKPVQHTTTEQTSPQRRSSRRKKAKKSKGKRRTGAAELPVPQGVVSYESESELSVAFQAMAMDGINDNLNYLLSDGASSTNELFEQAYQIQSSSLPDVEVSSSRPGSTRKRNAPLQIQQSGDVATSSSLTDSTSDDQTPIPRLNGTCDIDEIEGSHEKVVYAQVTKHKRAEANSAAADEERLYETLNYGLKSTAPLGSSMPIRDPPSPPPPTLPKRHSVRHKDQSSSSESETDDVDGSTDSEEDEMSYKTYEAPQFMKQLSRGQREKGLYQIALQKSYSKTFIDAVNKVKENNRKLSESQNSSQNLSENPSSSMTSMKSSGSELSTKSTMSTKSKACVIM
ncbi:uncharacterized protein [Antedon mediterranea]|uniref:uncharacterized protein isoform X1 n=1 Tax=Antedon mediterranea TaxID=105859 RepID=UPI003AF573E3